MGLSWENIRSLLIFFGPILLPKAYSWYRSFQSSRRGGASIQRVPQPVQIALAVLFGLCCTYIIKTLPYFAPENLFAKTESRIQIPVDVLFNRIAATRPNNALTEEDLALRGKFVNLESRLLYLQFGPRVLAECPFCTSDEPKSYFYYAIPDILWPHLANLVAIAVVTSPTWTGKYGIQWRTLATIAAALLAVVEISIVSSYNYQGNARALRLGDLDMFFWTLRNYRLVFLALLDGILGWVLYLSATNRAFTQPPSPAERVEKVNRTLLSAKSKMNALGIMRNTALRDEDLRSRSHAYWSHEVRLMNEVMEDRDVIDGVNDALSNRINIQEISRDAESYAENVLQPLEAEL
ncbi:unnamed protein product [Clonostachys rhizophaga]|uniref:Chorismate synthase protein n=1 Tax=Clonostachys rhizophaga TaxID=160324 RepID=A0A9N9V5K2_9HYPO|nr:unnamed protein product [Clonostachys rhizophaga]